MSSTKPIGYKRKWNGLERLPDNWSEWINPELQGLVAEWEDERAELETRDEYTVFLGRLRREWAIETGALESLYALTKDGTKALIEKGLQASNISHEDTLGKEPREVVAVIADQHEAIESLYDFVSGHRPLTTSYIKDLHITLCRHQETYELTNDLGQHLVRKLQKGQWKEEPNGIPGEIEFCPPFAVDAEMVQLLKWHSEYENAGVSPEILAAWLHHRFTLIHPFSDGNGRVARCLATLVFLKPRRFPLVVTRDDRSVYIDALRAADAGQLQPLVKVFGDIQARSVREAFTLTEEIAEGAATVTEILTKVTGRWETAQDAAKKQVFVTAAALHHAASSRFEEVAQQVTEFIRPWGDGFNARLVTAPQNDEKAGYYYIQVVQGAQALKYFANRRFYQSWVGIDIFTQNRTDIIFSFHGIGHSTGSIACLGVVFSKQLDQTGSGTPLYGQAKPLSDAPFVFTHTQDAREVVKRFKTWLEVAIVRGLDEWRKLEGA